MLKDEAFNVKEAEVYFTAISEYFKRGLPTATVLINQSVPDTADARLGMESRTPKIYIKIDSGIDKKGITPGTLKVTLNDLTVPTTRIDDSTYEVNYGLLCGGGHRLRFSFRNSRYQSSMVLTTCFALGFARGEFDRNIFAGSAQVDGGNAREGLQRLLPALYAGFTDPLGDKITYNIARGFEQIGDQPMAAYYYMTLNQFYPESPYREKVPGTFRARHVPTPWGVPVLDRNSGF